ncbi:TolC family protein [Spirosoma utsteinense]|uniref:NodT family efflux transporter outer membrane factor (OMF) lipoprotein n=1 Tax=Spirosoma utsteinense TaxID=2585773 RepID=A0ABR6W5B2_9BACT|nr:TolC family protein [Spirosoma utsteinense]MBC3785631.1 NodT family efflux transporter outer membrane factor (OMF) lipoprotein [Spirosoma utsteinense]MBC3791782.1 NodT family efflux transporter outer membrane factor (OMF) lipoprotein [Spirosoma utsteinense]
MVPLSFHKVRRPAGYVSIALLLLSSCQMPRPLLRPTARPVPVSFDGSSDSLGIASKNWRSFFGDPKLVQLIDTALAGNLDLRIATQRIEQARASYAYSRGFLAPQVNAVASAGVDRFGRNTLNGVGNFDTNLSDNIQGNLIIPNPTPDFFVGARSTWEVDIWGKLRNQRKAAYLRLLASEKGRHAVVTSLVAEIARYYYTLLALDGEREIIQKNIDFQQNAVNLVRIQKQAGRVTELAVQQFTAQLLNTQGRQGQVQQRIIETENQLNRLLGRYPQPITRGASLMQHDLPGQVETGIPAQMLLRRPDIQQAELDLQAANVDIDVARAQFLPSLNLSAYVGLNSFRAATLLDPASIAAGLLGGLSGPVLNRRFIRANYGQSVALSREAFYRYRQTILTGFSEVTTNLKGVENYRNVAALQAQEVGVLRQAVSVSNDLFAGGYASYLEVITAQRTVLEAELALINTKQAQFLSLMDLYRALGGGWE